MTQPSKFEEVSIIQAPTRFFAGFTYPVRAIALLLKSPALLGDVLVPIVVNILLGVALYFGILLPTWSVITGWETGLPTEISRWLATLPTWAQQILGWLPTGATLLDDVVRWLLAIALCIAIGLALVQFGAIVGAPWYGHLAEQVERSRLGQLPPAPVSVSRAIQDIRRAIAFQLKKLLLLVIFGATLLGFNFFPPFGNLIASIGWIALATVLVFLDFIDPPLERRRLSFRTKLSLIGRTLPASASFGLTALWLVSIPLLNLIAVPLCIVAGTLFCCDYALPKLGKEESKG